MTVRPVEVFRNGLEHRPRGENLVYVGKPQNRDRKTLVFLDDGWASKNAVRVTTLDVEPSQGCGMNRPIFTSAWAASQRIYDPSDSGGRLA